MIFTLFWLALNSWACTEIASFWDDDLIIASQEKTEWCFAHATANLFKVKLHKEIDASKLAQKFHLWENPYASESDPRFTRIGGMVPQTLKLALTQGICVGAPCEEHRIRGGLDRGMEKRSDFPWIKVLDRVLEEGEPFVLSIDMGFLRERGRFPHAILIVGRRQNTQGECEYLAIDSNRASRGFIKEYFQRNQEGHFYLKQEEIERYGLRMDYVRGKISSYPVGR